MAVAWATAVACSAAWATVGAVANRVVAPPAVVAWATAAWVALAASAVVCSAAWATDLVAGAAGAAVAWATAAAAATNCNATPSVFRRFVAEVWKVGRQHRAAAPLDHPRTGWPPSG